MRLSAAALAAVAGLALACGCGGHHGRPERPPSPVPIGGDRAALDAAVRSYTTAYTDDDYADAWELLSSRCQRRVGREEFHRRAAAVHAKYGELGPTTVTIERIIPGRRATVSYTFRAAALNQKSENWRYERRHWREDHC